nr:MAG TPA: hypothetical protein [Caudoviricetes sp.]
MPTIRDTMMMLFLQWQTVFHNLGSRFLSL